MLKRLWKKSFQDLFQEIDAEETLPNLFYKARITLTQKVNKENASKTRTKTKTMDQYCS